MKVDTYFSIELIRPWKLFALFCGVSTLWLGMVHERAADWTPSTIAWMSAATHLLAPWALDTILRLRWKLIPLALLAGWATIDGAWMVGVVLGDNTPAAWSLRGPQAPASACLFALYGILLRPKASLADMLRATSAALGLRPKKEIAG